MVNAEELRLALKRVEVAHPVLESGQILADIDVPPTSLAWDQQHWMYVGVLPDSNLCLTAGCLAGHVAHAHGFTVALNERTIANPETGETLRSDTTGPGSIRQYAADVLGLDDNQAGTLFRWSNTLDDLRCYVDKFIAADEARRE
jgi:hypothetical protein